MTHIKKQNKKCFGLPPLPPPPSHQILVKHFLNLIFVYVQSLTFKLYIISKLLGGGGGCNRSKIDDTIKNVVFF